MDPTQTSEFIGVSFDLVQGIVRPAREKLQRVQVKSDPFFQSKMVPAQNWEALLGLLNQLESYVPWGKIHLRSIQFNLLHHYTPQKILTFFLFQYGIRPSRTFFGGTRRRTSSKDAIFILYRLSTKFAQTLLWKAGGLTWTRR